MTEKFCKDCKHFRRDIMDSAICARPIALRRKDLVFGAREAYLGRAPWLERADRAVFKWLFRDQCGQEGKYFEPKIGGGNSA